LGCNEKLERKLIMKYKKRNLILAILIFSIFLLQSTALASARYIPPGEDPPPPSYTYRFLGWVKETETNTPISGATVKIYKGTTVLIQTVSTDSNGYYSYTYRTSTQLTSCKTVASKSGYDSSTIVMPVPDYVARMDHYLNKLIQTYIISGHVEASDTGEGIAGANIEIYSLGNSNSELIATTTTETSGDFSTSYATYNTIYYLEFQVEAPTYYVQSGSKVVQVTGTTVNAGTIELAPDPSIPYNELVYRDSCDCVSRWTKVLPGEFWDRGPYTLGPGTLGTEDGYLYADIPVGSSPAFTGPRYYQKILNPVKIKDIADLSINLEMINPSTIYMGKLFVDFYDTQENLAFRVEIGDYNVAAYDTWIGGYYIDSSGGHYSNPELHLSSWSGTVYFRYRTGLGLNFYGPQTDGTSKEVRLIDEADMGADNERQIAHIVLSFERYSYHLLTQLFLHSIEINAYKSIPSSPTEIWHIDGSTLLSEFQFDSLWFDESEMSVTNHPQDWTIRSNTNSIEGYSWYELNGNPLAYTPTDWEGPCYVHNFDEAIFMDQIDDLSVRVVVDRYASGNYVGKAYLTFYDQLLKPVFRIYWGDLGNYAWIWAYYYTESGVYTQMTGTYNSIQGSSNIFVTDEDKTISFRYQDGIGIVGSYQGEGDIVLCTDGCITLDRKLQCAVLQMGWDGTYAPHLQLRLRDIRLSVASDTVAMVSANAILQYESILEWSRIDTATLLTSDIGFEMPDMQCILGPVRVVLEGYSESPSASISFSAYFRKGGANLMGQHDFTKTGNSFFTEIFTMDPYWVMWWGESAYPNTFAIQTVANPTGVWYIKATLEYAYIAAGHLRQTSLTLFNHWQLSMGSDSKDILIGLPNRQDSPRSCLLSFIGVANDYEGDLEVYIDNRLVEIYHINNEPFLIDTSIDISGFIGGKGQFTLRFYASPFDVGDAVNLFEASIYYRARLFVAPDGDDAWNNKYHLVYSRSALDYRYDDAAHPLCTMTAKMQENPDRDSFTIKFGLDMVQSYNDLLPLAMSVQVKIHGGTGETSPIISSNVFGLDEFGNNYLSNIGSDCLSAISAFLGLAPILSPINFLVKIANIGVKYLPMPTWMNIGLNGFTVNQYSATIGAAMELTIGLLDTGLCDYEIILTSQVGYLTFTDTIWYYNLAR
jgi:5-hydroxyisourate hydrolase-like protein (transthyretin family)